MVKCQCRSLELLICCSCTTNGSNGIWAISMLLAVRERRRKRGREMREGSLGDRCPLESGN